MDIERLMILPQAYIMKAFLGQILANVPLEIQMADKMDAILDFKMAAIFGYKLLKQQSGPKKFK